MKLNRETEPIVLTDMRPLSVAHLVRRSKQKRRAEALRFVGCACWAIAGWLFIYAWLQ